MKRREETTGAQEAKEFLKGLRDLGDLLDASGT